MNPVKPLSKFFDAIRSDYRISSTHIGIYAALLYLSEDRGYCNPIEAFSSEIMGTAKISAHRTYRKCLKEMTEYGYLKYVPSFKKNKASKIFFTIDYDERSNAECCRGNTDAADFTLQRGEIA
jgi:hypothetical protein